MTEVQAALLGLLKEIDAICRKYNIEYYLGGGTQIGAVRHSEFLPWDDDADIHMSRENARKFLDAVKKENLPNRIVHAGVDREKNVIAQWRYENTSSTVLLRGLVGTEVPKGQFVDIYVNYPLPVDEKKKERCIEDFRIYCELIANNRVSRSQIFGKFQKRYAFLILIEKIVGRETLLRYFEKKIFQHPEDDAVEWLICSPSITKENVPKAYWGKPRYVQFEDTMLPIAEYVGLLLSYYYSPSWFEVPAYAERGSHIFVIDLEIPYTAYEDDLNKHFDVKKFYSEKIQKKRRWVQLLQDRNLVNPHLRKLQGLCLSLEIQHLAQKNELDFTGMITQGQEDVLQGFFESYFNKVDSHPIKYWGIYIDMPDEYLYAALYFQCFNGNYAIARKILNQRRTQIQRTLSSNLQRLCNLCDATDALLTALYADLDMELARQLVDEWLVKEPTALYFLRANIYLCLNGFGTEPDAELLRRCDRYLEQYPDDGELLKYRGDLLLRLGRNEEGERCYRKALCSLRNGFCIRAIKEYFEAKRLEAVG